MAEPTSFGHYELRELIGRGGMGEVYRAFDREHGRLVALKLLPRDLAGDAQFAERFRRESYAAARLRDPHVIPIHRYGEIDGRLYIDMQLVDGRDLGRILAESGPLSPRRALHILGQAAEALHAAHAEHLVHRDVKPSNLLVAEGKGDFVYLVDFGIAHVMGTATDGTLTAHGSTVGTLAYMAPERFAGGDIDGRADVYSLACVLYQMLTGRRPFPSDTAAAVIAAHLAAPPPSVTAVRPELPAAWDAVVARGMAKQPAARYATPRDLVADAARIGPNGTTPLAPAPVPQVQPAVARPGGASRAGWVTAMTLLALVAVLGGAVLLSVLRDGRVSAGTAGAADRTTARTASTAAAGSAEPPPRAGTAATASTGHATGTAAAPRPPGDLGLAVPISSPPCDGGFAVFVAAAVTPGSYAGEVQGFLDRFPGTAYLLAEDSCSSLRPRTETGDSIYAVYYGPYRRLADACATLGRIGGDSYLRRLDDVTPAGEAVEC